MNMTERAWPFFLAATRTSGYRLVVAPDFMLGHSDALGALRASPEHLGGAASGTALREVDSAGGRFCIVYRVSDARLRDFGLGGDGPVTDHVGRRIDIFEGLVFRGFSEECARLAIGTADLDRVRDVAREHYQRFWSQPGPFRIHGSQPFAVTGRGPKVQLTMLPPWRDMESIFPGRGPVPALPAGPAEVPADGQPVDNGPVVTEPLVPVAEKHRRKLSRRTRGAAMGITAAIVCAAVGGVVWARSGTPPVLRPTGLRVGWSKETSMELDWAGPAAGPPPYQYRIVLDEDLDGKKVFLVPGTRTSYLVTGLTPATDYSFRVTAIRDRINSPESAPAPASTVTPLPWQGLLTGSWPVRYMVTDASSDQEIFVRGLASGASWDITPDCDSGACAEVTLAGRIAGRVSEAVHFAVPLRLSQGVYLGSGPDSLQVCPGYSAHPIRARDTLSFQIRATQAGLDAGLWKVTAWTGKVEIHIAKRSYTNWQGENAACPGGTIQFAVAG